MEDRILEKAEYLFFKYGFKSVTMDDIAKDLGISKKTLYIHFKDKNEIVRLIVENLVASHKERSLKSASKAANAVEEIQLQVDALLETFKDMKASILYEIEKYFPDANALLTLHQSEYIVEGIKLNIQRGTSEGLFHQQFEEEFLIDMRLNLLSSAFQENIYPSQDKNLASILKKTTMFYLNAICNKNGRKLIEQ